MKRAILATLMVIAAVAAFVQLHGFYSRKFHVSTGHGQWIWDTNRIAAERPVVFFATRDFDIPPNRHYVHIKVVADPEYILYFNGQQLGGRRFRGAGVIDRYDVSQIAKTGRNRIVIAVRSAKGVGGLLAGVDLAPLLENWVVTDEQWRIFSIWSDQILLRDPPALIGRTPRLLGRPPVGRWDYLTEVDARPRVEQTILQPRASIEFDSSLPQIKVAGGVAVATSRPTHARAFDFGFIRGRARIEVRPVGSLVVKIRYANDPSEFANEAEVTALALAPGEEVVIDPEVRRFRYVIVYDVDAHATVLVE